MAEFLREKFLLEAWELPPGAERRYLIEPFESNCLEGWGVASATYFSIPYSPPHEKPDSPARQLVFFQVDSGSRRPADGPAPNYVIVIADDIGTLETFGPEATRSDVESALRTAQYASQTSWSPVYYDISRYLTLPQVSFLIRDGVGCCIDGEQNKALFRLPEDVSRGPSPILYQWLQDQLAQPNSALSFTLQWVNRSVPERYYLLAEYFPALGQLHRLLVAIARIQSEFTPMLRCEHGSKLVFFPPSALGATREQFPEMGARLEKWGTLLGQYNPLPRLSEADPSCMSELYTRLRSDFIVPDVTPFSEHERMEAAQFLREWVRDKVTAEEMETLF